MNNLNNSSKESNKGNMIQPKDLKNLDEFIQKCLDNFKFVEPKKELYEATGNDKDLIISHKSTIPDLVIWNKTFNKNKCFIGANTSLPNEFPRYLFYIKIKKNKKKHFNKNNTNNKYIKDNDFDFDFFEDKQPVQKNIKNNIKKENENENNIGGNFNPIKDNQNKRNDFNFYQNNKINISNFYEDNNNKYKSNDEKNKFSISQRTMMNQSFNGFDMNNLTIYLIQLYLHKNGWIILTSDRFSGPGTSINLFQFLQEKIKENINLNEFIIIDINKQVRYFGNYFYIILSNILPIIIQKNQMEMIKFEEIMNKQNNIIHTNMNKFCNNNITNTINNNNEILFSGFENNNNILEKILIEQKNKINDNSINSNINNNIGEINGKI